MIHFYEMNAHFSAFFFVIISEQASAKGSASSIFDEFSSFYSSCIDSYFLKLFLLFRIFLIIIEFKLLFYHFLNILNSFISKIRQWRKIGSFLQRPGHLIFSSFHLFPRYFRERDFHFAAKSKGIIAALNNRRLIFPAFSAFFQALPQHIFTFFIYLIQFYLLQFKKFFN